MSRDTTRFSLDAIDGLTNLLPAPNTVDVTIEVLEESIGDQIEALRLPWHTLVYDIRNHVIELSVGGRDHRIPVRFRHSIHKPTRVWLEQEEGRPTALLIEAEESAKTIIRFHERAALGPGDNIKTASPSPR